ncbi:MAG: UbiA family prenyltransferase [Pyrinomonadaceae bacterium]|nr:UbiA family prenyltransferase [Pyrinomonadaceae bacterium]
MTEKSKVFQATAPLRISEWWESKFAPLFGNIYATCLLLQIPFINLFLYFAFLLTALLPGAVFVSVINDLTDLEEDKIAGKTNRLEGKSKLFAGSLIAICLAFGILISFFLSKITLALYLCAWFVFACYSVPPIRLKKRGIWGVFADTLGANVFPQLFAISLLFDWVNREIDFRWFGLIGVWSFLFGLRGIISHQLTDRKNDQIASVQTFVQNYKNSSIKQIFNWLIFPLEFCVLLFLLYSLNNWWGLGFLAVYVIWLTLIYFVWEVKFGAVIESTKKRILMNEYYFIFYPLSLLLKGLTIFPNTWVVIILHSVFFSLSLLRFVSDLVRLFLDWKKIWLIIREFLFGY